MSDREFDIDCPPPPPLEKHKRKLLMSPQKILVTNNLVHTPLLVGQENLETHCHMEGEYLPSSHCLHKIQLLPHIFSKS